MILEGCIETWLLIEGESRLITFFYARTLATGKVNTFSIRFFFHLFLIFMPVPMMDIGHMTMLVFFSGVFMLM